MMGQQSEDPFATFNGKSTVIQAQISNRVIRGKYSRQTRAQGRPCKNTPRTEQRVKRQAVNNPKH